MKFAELEASLHFIPVAIKTTGVCGLEALLFFRELRHCLKAETGDPSSLQFLVWGILVAKQRDNAAAIWAQSRTIIYMILILNYIYISMTCMLAQESVPLLMYYCML